MTRLPCIVREPHLRLLGAAIDSSAEGDDATALTHLLAASGALEAAGRPGDARQVRDLARRLGLALPRVRDAHEVG